MRETPVYMTFRAVLASGIGGIGGIKRCHPFVQSLIEDYGVICSPINVLRIRRSPRRTTLSAVEDKTSIDRDGERSTATPLSSIHPTEDLHSQTNLQPILLTLYKRAQLTHRILLDDQVKEKLKRGKKRRGRRRNGEGGGGSSASSSSSPPLTVLLASFTFTHVYKIWLGGSI